MLRKIESQFLYHQVHRISQVRCRLCLRPWPLSVRHCLRGTHEGLATQLRPLKPCLSPPPQLVPKRCLSAHAGDHSQGIGGHEPDTLELHPFLRQRGRGSMRSSRVGQRCRRPRELHCREGCEWVILDRRNCKVPIDHNQATSRNAVSAARGRVTASPHVTKRPS